MSWKFPYCPQPNEEINWVGIVDRFNFPEELNKCGQDPNFHSEGDVWTHTKMVVVELVNNEIWKQLDEGTRNILFASALLHDIGKPLQAKAKEGNINSNHAVKGTRLARELMYDSRKPDYLETPTVIREAICNMILLHMIPYYFLDNTSPIRTAYSSSYFTNNDLLCLLAISDINGRIVTDKVSDDGMERVDLFRELCEEHNCLKNPKEFPSDNARFRYFFEHKGSPNYDYYEEEKSTVTMMCGLPAVGKTTYLEKANQPIVSLDQIRLDLKLKHGKNEGKVCYEARKQMRIFMRKSEDFIFDSTNTIKGIREQWIRFLRGYGCKIKIHYLERPFEDILKNNYERENPTPEKAVEKKMRNIDPPSLLECHEFTGALTLSPLS